LRLGNIHQYGWQELAGSALYREFGSRKRRLHPECPECPYFELCAGDCLKHRVLPSATAVTPRGLAMPGEEEGSGRAGAAAGGKTDPRALSRLCGGWKAFYRRTLPGFRRLAREIQRQRSRALEERMRRDYGSELRSCSSGIR
jgi:uncharacterized protein